jgi:predicted RNA-binding Zn-ribbon protein involved in translation (DUF1610 family)
VALIVAEIERVGPVVREHLAAAEEEASATTSALRRESTASCPHCGGWMWMRPVQVRRTWWRLWVCSACGKMVRATDLPVENQPGGIRA